MSRITGLRPFEEPSALQGASCRVAASAADAMPADAMPADAIAADRSTGHGTCTVFVPTSTGAALGASQ
jgi:hypothetical protein